MQVADLDDIRKGNAVGSITNKFKLMFSKQQAEIAKQLEDETKEKKKSQRLNFLSISDHEDWVFNFK
mgnify:CR=1 FL=1